MVALPGVALAREPGTPRDRAATRAYLEAELAYQRVLVAAVPAAKERDAAVASRLTSECPRVLAGAPFEQLESRREPPERVPTPRQMGEGRRLERQWSDLQEELSFVLDEPTEAVRQAAITYARAIEAIHWDDRILTAFEHQSATTDERELQVEPPDPCADMRTWAASGYQKISAATKAFEAQQEAAVSPLRESLPAFIGEGTSGGTGSPLRYAGPRERALARMVTQLKRTQLASRGDVEAFRKRIETALGIPQELEARPTAGPPKGAVVIGHGRTTVGSSYTISVVPLGASSLSRSQRCAILGISESSGSSSGTSGTTNECISRFAHERPRVLCEEGKLEIEAHTLSAARRVRLKLSDGRRVVSSVATVPAHLGGPIGIYFQAVRGPSPIPVALTELDARGRPLRTVALEHVARCVKHEPAFTFGPSRTIAHGSVPGGPTFSIVGLRVGTEGQQNLELEANVADDLESGGTLAAGGDLESGSIVSVSGEAVSIAREGTAPTRRPFAPEARTGCRPREYAILYGVLRDPRDTVLARGTSGLTPFRHAAIPAVLHAHGVLAYVGLQGVPSEIIVRGPEGKTLYVQTLTVRARATRETCEGEAEPAG